MLNELTSAVRRTRPSGLDLLPPDMQRKRVLPLSDAAIFVGNKPSYWRQLWKEGKTPPHIQIGARKVGWTLGSLIDYVEARSRAA